MDKVYQEIQEQWHGLVDDPHGPAHFLDSRFDAIKHHDVPYHLHCAKALIRMCTNNSLVELQIDATHVDLKHNVTRSGDVLVGLILRGPVLKASVDLKVGMRPICRLDVDKDEPCLVLGGDNVLPLVAVPYQATELHTTGPIALDLIYAYIACRERHELATHSWSIEFNNGTSWLHTTCGMALLEPHGPRYHVLPRIAPAQSWRQGLERQKERTRVWEEELIAATWHPSRFQDWCWDTTEKMID
jgi:hypothetical protein